MAQNSGRAKRSEKGLLTPDNCVVAIIDLQPQMLFGVSNFDRQTIINNNVALLKAAKVFDVPVVLSTVETKSFSGNMWPQIQAVFPHQTPIERSSMNSWDDKKFVDAIEKSGKKKIVLAGLWTETCVALPTVQAIHDNYEVYVVEDCCGDVSQLAHDNAMKRVVQAGAKPVTALSVMLEWLNDSHMHPIRGSLNYPQQQAPPEARFLPLAADNSTAEGTAKTIAAFPEVDILVNNLGIYEAVGFFDEKDWAKGGLRDVRPISTAA